MSESSTVAGRSVLYPIGLKLEGRHCLVVGSGSLARKKTGELRECGALVRVIAPEDGDRPFAASDLDGVHLVVVATDDPRVQEDVSREAAARGIPCNVVDVNHLCTFYAPAVLRRGSLTISVATDGKFPLLSVAIKDRIAAELGEAIGPALELLAHGRELACARFPNEPEERVTALRLLLSDHAIESILEGRLDELKAHYESWTTQL